MKLAAYVCISLRYTILLISIVAIGSTANSPFADAGQRLDKTAAFVAAFGIVPPMKQTGILFWKKGLFQVGDAEEGASDSVPVTRTTTPALLFPLGANRYALAALESYNPADHAQPGAVSIAYVQFSRGTWRLERLWPDIARSGSFGNAADRSWTQWLSGRPCFVVSASWCGMGKCFHIFTLIALAQQGPILLGNVPGGDAIYADEYPDCRTYSYEGALGEPLRPQDLLSVRYSGWTAPPGLLKPRKLFSIVNDFKFAGTNLVANPILRLPNCEGG